MKLENGKIVLGSKSCWCKDGTQPSKIQCRECKGTGNGKRGGKGGCKVCYGYGYKCDQVNRIQCDVCKGKFENFEAETYCDYLPADIYAQLEVKVYRIAGHMPITESLLGLDCVYSCNDRRPFVEETEWPKLVEEVKNTKCVQATKVCKGDGTIADHIGVIVRPDGYSVKAIFKQ